MKGLVLNGLSPISFRWGRFKIGHIEVFYGFKYKGLLVNVPSPKKCVYSYVTVGQVLCHLFGDIGSCQRRALLNGHCAIESHFHLSLFVKLCTHDFMEIDIQVNGLDNFVKGTLSVPSSELLVEEPSRRKFCCRYCPFHMLAVSFHYNPSRLSSQWHCLCVLRATPHTVTISHNWNYTAFNERITLSSKTSKVEKDLHP